MTLRFGTDGVRGVANRELTPELVTALGRAAARLLGAAAPFVVGRDTRRSGPMLEAALTAGICGEGAGVELAGVLPTPGVAHLAQVRGAPGAVISASHNPFADNGVKLLAPGGRKLSDQEEAQVEAELRALASAAPSDGPDGTGVGVVRRLTGAHDEYVAHLVASARGHRLDGMRVVVDCGNGAAFLAAPRALTELGATVDARSDRPDGTNINAGCGATDPKALQAWVRETGADAGLALDGDADRVIAVDERGEVVDGDQILAVLALDLHARGDLPGPAIVATVMSNLGLRQALGARGIEVIETPVGDRAVLAALQADGLRLGGEQSGHIVRTDLATTGDGTLTSILLLDALARARRPLSELAAIVTRLPQVLRNVPVGGGGRVDTSDRLWDEVAAVERELNGTGRVLVRASGTEPVVRVMVEAPTEEQAEAIAERVSRAVESATLGP